MRHNVRHILLFLMVSMAFSTEIIGEWSKERPVLDGYWALSGKWMGYMGVSLFIQGDKYSAYFYSDVVDARDPYPHKADGTILFSDDGNGFSLKGSRNIYANDWRVLIYRGQFCLISKGDYDELIKSKKLDDSRLLFRISNNRIVIDGKPVMNAPLESK